ncbi:uncharacterized protein LOC134699553 [Mytilus trossulus]|uniref:uncharacterized protein LOC134699553 n=1 Tax=Mytilus trossulus TaxID=6551 RepID=UPI0030055CE5
MAKFQLIYWTCLVVFIRIEVLGDTESRQNIDFFRCVYLYREKIACEWQADSTCSSWTFTYSLENSVYHNTSTPIHNYNCTDLVSTAYCTQIVETTNCLDGNGLCLNDDKSYEFGLSGKCENNTLATGKFVVPLNDTYAKMEPVEDIFVFPTSNTFTIGWKFNKPLNMYGSPEYVCQLNVVSRTQSYNITFNTLHQTVATNISVVMPGTSYTFRIKCRPEMSIVWSEESEIQTTSKYTVPLTGPLLTSGGFVQKKENLYIYFKEPEKYKAQGNISNVQLTLQSSTSNDTMTTTVHDTNTADIKTCWASGHAGFRLIAVAKNQIGWSHNITEIVFYPDSDVPRPSYVIVEVNKAMNSFTISYEGDISPSNITYIWCLGHIDQQSGVVMCEEDVNWKYSTNEKFTGILDSHFSRRWHFGMSISTNKKDSGIEWENCIFHQTERDNRNLKPTINKIGTTFIVLMIPRSFCQSNGYRPLQYSVQYGLLNNHVTNKTTRKASSTRNNITIDGLKSNTVYKLVYTTDYIHGTNLPVSFTVTTLTETKDSAVSNSVVILVTCLAVGLVGCVLLAVRFKDKLKDIFKCLCYKPDIEPPTIPINSISRQELEESNDKVDGDENDNMPENNGYVKVHVFGTTNSNHSNSSGMFDDASNSACPLLETSMGNCLHSQNKLESTSVPVNECHSDPIVEEDQTRDMNECLVHSVDSYVQSDVFEVPSVLQENSDTRCVVQVRCCQQVNDENIDQEAGRNCKVQETSFYSEDYIQLNLTHDCSGNLEHDYPHIERSTNQNDEVYVLKNHTDHICNQQGMDHATLYVRAEDLHIENFPNQQDVNNASSYFRPEDLQNVDSFSKCVHAEHFQKNLSQQNVDDVLYSRTELLPNNQHIQDSSSVQEIKANESNDVSSESLNHPSQPTDDSSSLHDQTDSGFQSNSGYISHEKLNDLD